MSGYEIRPRYCCMTYPGQEHSRRCQKRYDDCPDKALHLRAMAYGTTCTACKEECD